MSLWPPRREDQAKSRMGIPHPRGRSTTCAGRLRSWLSSALRGNHFPSGDVLTVEGSLDEVEKRLSDAARSGQSRLAWFKERGRGDSVGLNAAHVVALRASEISD
jgi:hypothetical protein